MVATYNDTNTVTELNLQEYRNRKGYESRRKYILNCGVIPQHYIQSEDQTKALILADMHYYAIEMCIDAKTFSDAQVQTFIRILQETHDHCMDDNKSEGIDGDIIWFQNRMAEKAVHRSPDTLKVFDSLAQISQLDAYVRNTYFYNYSMYKLTFTGKSIVA